MNKNSGLKQISVLLFAILLFFRPVSVALANDYGDNQSGVQANYTSDGVSIGLVHFWQDFEMGYFGGFTGNNAANQTKVLTVGAFGGHRTDLGSETVFAFGLDVTTGFGTLLGNAGYRPILIGPYVSIEYVVVGTLVLISAWINPYLYSAVSADGTPTVVTHSFFSTGGIGFSYLF